MLINFKSPASGDVVMFEKNARELLLALGKQPDEAKGVITVAQLPGPLPPSNWPWQARSRAIRNRRQPMMKAKSRRRKRFP